MEKRDHLLLLLLLASLPFTAAYRMFVTISVILNKKRGALNILKERKNQNKSQRVSYT